MRAAFGMLIMLWNYSAIFTLGSTCCWCAAPQQGADLLAGDSTSSMFEVYEHILLVVL